MRQVLLLTCYGGGKGSQDALINARKYYCRVLEREEDNWHAWCGVIKVTF